MNTVTFKNVTEDELKRLAHLIAPLAHTGDVIALTGDLGAGKSVFARAFIRTAMGQNDLDVPSPTYTIVQTYHPPKPQPEIWHVDLYRLEKPEDITELGLKDAQEAVLLIEWPERLDAKLLGNGLSVTIAAGKTKTTRTVKLTPSLSWRERIRKINLIRQ